MKVFAGIWKGTKHLHVRSHGAIFSECDCIFLTSHGIGSIDVNYTVHTVRLDAIKNMTSFC